MRAIDEASFREALDAHGVLREGAIAFPTPADTFTVFAQRHDARIEVGEWRRHAERFFATRVGLTVDKRYEAEPPSIDAARVVVAPLEGPGETRIVWGRPRTSDDLRAAEDAEARSEGSAAGLASLAKRCGHVWLVEREHADDAIALRLAAIIAGVVLGPILAPGAAAIFGPKTARVKLGV